MVANRLDSSVYKNTNEVWIMDKPVREWITTKEAAEIMGITQQAVQRLCRREVIECQRFGRWWKVSKASAERYEITPGGRGNKAKSNDS